MQNLESIINKIVNEDSSEGSPSQELSDIEEFIKALSGGFNTDQQLIANKVLNLGLVLLRKNRNYGSSVFKQPVLSPDISTDAAIRVRMSDKVERLTNLFKGENDLVGESHIDTVTDLCGYCLLWLIYKERLEQ